MSSFQYLIIVSIPHSHDSGTVWNTNDDRYSDFGHFLKKWKLLYIETCPHFLIVSIFENVETSVCRKDLGRNCFGAKRLVTILYVPACSITRKS